MSASAIRATGNSVSSARAHMGQVTGKRTPGSFHAASFPLLLFNSGTGSIASVIQKFAKHAHFLCRVVVVALGCGARPFRRKPPAPRISFASTARTSSIVGHDRQCRIHIMNDRLRTPLFSRLRAPSRVVHPPTARRICDHARRPLMRRRTGPRGSPEGTQGLPVRSSM